MKTIDVKSLIIGILGTALVMILMGVTNENSTEIAKIVIEETNKNGRYQVACGLADNTRCVVLDTTNGEVFRDLKCRGLLGCK